ncbi:MAG: hypothetical protein K2H28_02265, partial [Ruminococcus sp.]|nr:hypothetical protein [Ruminococcus sp.]
MTEDEFREKMLEYGRDEDEIDERIIMYHMRQLYGIEDKLYASTRVIVESFPCFSLVQKHVRELRKIAEEHSRIFGYDVTEVCPKVKKLLSDDTISDEQHDLEQLEKSLKKSIMDNFDYLPRKYRYT